MGVPHTWYLSAQSFIRLLKLVWREYDIVAMNEWKKKCVGLQRTWVSERTVYSDYFSFGLYSKSFIFSPAYTSENRYNVHLLALLSPLSNLAGINTRMVEMLQATAVPRVSRPCSCQGQQSPFPFTVSWHRSKWRYLPQAVYCPNKTFLQQVALTTVEVWGLGGRGMVRGLLSRTQVPFQGSIRHNNPQGNFEVASAFYSFCNVYQFS